MATQRMDKTAFLKALDGRSPDDLRALLWTAYWRGTAATRERIEELLAPQEAAVRRAEEAQVDPALCLDEVVTFCARARNGDYIRGARDLGRKAVTGWRFTLRRLFDESCRLLEQNDFQEGSEALETLLDFTCELKGRCYFRSEDQVEAAKVVVSDRIEALWLAQIRQEGFAFFIQKAPAQLLRWEEPYGWTTFGGGQTAEKERQLADLLPRLLPGADGFLVFCRAYLETLERLHTRQPDPKARKRTWNDPLADFARDSEKRADRLEGWHALILERMAGTDDEIILERILEHRAIQGPKTWHLLGRLRQAQGRLDEAQGLVKNALSRYPGSPEFQNTALALGCAADQAR
jgi:hypothetical protein